MRKLSELLSIAIKYYQEECGVFDLDKGGLDGGYPYMCTVIGQLYQDKVFNSMEFELFYTSIQEWINYRVTLKTYLLEEGLPCNRAARLLFYENKLAELKENGE